MARHKKHALFKKRNIRVKAAAPDPSANNPIHAYVNAHLEWLGTIGRREQGIKLAGKSLRRFVAWCDEHGLQQPQEVTLPILERYQRHLFHYRQPNGKPLAFTSQQLLLVPLKSFFKWATRSRHLLYNPASELVLPKTPLRLPAQVLTIAEVEHVINQPDTEHISGVRDRAILETLYSTAMRRTELAQLMVFDWDRSRGAIGIRQGKGGKDRVVPIGERAAAWLARYVDDVRPQLVIEPDGGSLFLTDYGEPLEKNRLGDLVRRYVDYAGITVPGSCHLFRHACATHMLENGADIRYIQVLLGHSSVETTQIYTQVSIMKLKEIHAATHPARLQRGRGAEPGGQLATDSAVNTLLAALEAEDEDI
jgi:integrase/recombinase XerD